MDEGYRGEPRTRRVIVGLGGSLGTLAALHRAVDEARRTGAEVPAPLARHPQGGEHVCHRAPCPSLLTVREESAGARLRKAVDEAFGGAPAGVPLRARTVRGDAGLAPVRAADRPDDVLVVGAGSGDRLRRGLRPSMTAHCVKHAACPVPAVPKPALQREPESFHRRTARHPRATPAAIH
ncbi:universal stress protein [Kitasatospora sp. NPDC059571]|uniref:universal stress protein n=1 Tax=Kitasatospora sp. NPDC059571 TaxID=3346871 RepID=UPI0036AF98BF